MAIGVNWKEIWAPVWKPVWTQTPPVQVPDVVGETQAAGTLELENAGFVVAVDTAYSSVVAAGIIISQDPVAGSTPGTGATVTIVVSLGEAPQPPASDEQPSGGYGWQNWYDMELQRRRRRKRELDQAREEVERIEDRVEREIGQILQQQERADEKRADLERLRGMLNEFPKTHEASQGTMSQRTFEALERARIRGTLSALAQLDRELKQMEEELETALIMVLAS